MRRLRSRITFVPPRWMLAYRV